MERKPEMPTTSPFMPAKKLDETVTRDEERGRRFFAKANSNERLIKVIDHAGGDKVKVADALGCSKGHIHDVLSGRSQMSKVLDLACQAILSRFQKDIREPVRSLIVIQLTAPQSEQVRPILSGLGIKPCLDMSTLNAELNEISILIFSCDPVHHLTVMKLLNAFNVKSSIVHQ